jgi:hypothetical protein
MRNAVNVRVERAIVHILDHRHNNLTLSDLELRLTPDERLQEYFDAQVVNALADGEAHAANFAQGGQEKTKEICIDLVDGRGGFVKCSKELAQRLYDAVGSDKRIAPGNLIVCLCSASNLTKPFLALLKIDPSQVLVTRVSKSEGRRAVTFDIRGDVLPTVRERLQKAALVRHPRTRVEYDLLLLDRQVKGAAADFFAKTFLNARPALDARSRTDRFYMSVQSAYNALRPTLDAEQSEDLLTQLDAALEVKRLNTDVWVQALDLPEEAKSVIRTNLDEQLPDREFDVDTAYASQQLVKKRRFRGDYNTLFEVEADHYATVVKQSKEFTRRDGTPVTQLTLEIPNLRLVKK